jgi:hypothetical protein
VKYLCLQLIRKLVIFVYIINLYQLIILAFVINTIGTFQM